MKKAKLKKTSSGFIPEDVDDFKDVKDGDIIEVSWVKPRDPIKHRKFFKLLDVVIENMREGVPNRFKNKEFLRYTMLYDLGYVESVVTWDNKVIYRPISMSFDKLDEYKFEEIYDRSKDWLINNFISDDPYDRNNFINEYEKLL